MIDIVLKKDKTIRRTKHEDIYEGENKISWINVYLPETINDIDIKDYNIVLRCYINADNYIPYTLDTTKPINKIDITHEFTDKDRYIDAYLYITRADEVIGKTNTVSFRVNKAKDGSGLTPREQFDERIAELENENEGLEREVAEKDETISEQTEQITELSGEVTELTNENTRLENLTDTQRETIQNMLDNPPQPRLYTPPVVTPSGSVQQINPPTGYDGLNNAVVDRVSAEGVNFHPEWYKEGKECLGEVGTYNPFPEHSYGGIYYTELGEGGYPKKILIKDMEKSANSFVFNHIFDSSLAAVRELKEIIFENCPSYLSISGFGNSTYLERIILPNSLTNIDTNTFQYCRSIAEIILPNSLVSLGYQAFLYCVELKKIVIPNSLQTIGNNVFLGCTSLTNLNLAQGFNCNNLNLSSSTLYSVETIVSWLEALADRTGETAYTLTMGTTNLNKLTAEQKAIAINKNWNLA